MYHTRDQAHQKTESSKACRTTLDDYVWSRVTFGLARLMKWMDGWGQVGTVVR
jgi:hypothetical protein